VPRKDQIVFARFEILTEIIFFATAFRPSILYFH
jgi:hypothetical protein